MTGHPADADYSAFNEPNEADLMERLESAMLLADIAQGRGRRRVNPDGTGVSAVVADELYDRQGVAAPIASPQEQLAKQQAYHQKFDDLLRAARLEPSKMSDADQQVIEQAIAIIGEHVRRLREGGTGTSDIGRHACNSIELGLIGLAKLGGG